MESKEMSKLSEFPSKSETPELAVRDALEMSESAPDVTPNSDKNKQIDVENDSENHSEKGISVLSEANPVEADYKNTNIGVENKQVTQQNCSINGEVPVVDNTPNFSTYNNGNSSNKEKLSEVVVKTSKPLCANYNSDSDCESVDSESDSSTTSTDTSTEVCSNSEYESEGSSDSVTVKSKTVKGEKKLRGDLSLVDLPPIESLRISVPEDECVEIGKISSIVETLVIVESYKGTSALDIDTILFLDCGKQTLGKVFDILGPVSEPVYAVRFNSEEHIKSLNIKKDMKVYYAPKTEHTTFVFMSEVLKNRGSDASWKDNAEAPPEFQDFSDDEEERRHKSKQSREFDRENPSQKEQNKCRKRPFNKFKQIPGTLQGTRFRSPDFSQQRPYFQRNPSVSQFGAPPSFPRPNFPSPVQIPPFPYNVPSYPPASSSQSRPSNLLVSPRFSGPPFPTFGGLAFVNHAQNFQQPFYQQRTNSFPQGFGAWLRPMFRPPPPPPPPASDQSERQPSSEVRP